MNRQELLDALTTERYDQTWWKTPTHTVPAHDDDLAAVRRRRALLDADRDDVAAEPSGGRA